MKGGGESFTIEEAFIQTLENACRHLETGDDYSTLGDFILLHTVI